MRNTIATTYNHEMRIFMLVVLGLLNLCLMIGCSAPKQDAEPGNGITKAYQQHKSNVQVTGDGVVMRVLPDDTSGLTHQRFIVQIPSGQTILIEFNTDVATRIEDLEAGDAVSFAGEYIWNEQGGLVHWTHHAPAGRHPSGWLRHKGRIYE
ncbi:hypothetical protein BH10ACI3_BH10ACI3_08960 [soil metagenome]